MLTVLDLVVLLSVSALVAFLTFVWNGRSNKKLRALSVSRLQEVGLLTIKVHRLQDCLAEGDTIQAGALIRKDRLHLAARKGNAGMQALGPTVIREDLRASQRAVQLYIDALEEEVGLLGLNIYLD